MKWQNSLCKLVVFGVLVSCKSHKVSVCENRHFVEQEKTETTISQKYQIITDSLWLFPYWKTPYLDSALLAGALERRPTPAPPGRPPFIVCADAAPQLVAVHRQTIVSQQTSESQQAASRQAASIQQKQQKTIGKKKSLPKWLATLAGIVLGSLTLFMLIYRRK